MTFEKKNEIVIMDFSGIYRQERFHEGTHAHWVEVQGLPGSNCYCDEEAMEFLRRKIEKLPVQGIHFIDSGNYHYMSRIWLEKIQEPFRLLLFDNHTDMQPPAFGGILSCGGWADASLRELPLLREVVLTGPSEEDFLQVERKCMERVRFFGKEALRESGGKGLDAFLQEIPLDLPIYLSIDKDVLCKEDAFTAWSQGDMKLDVLVSCLEKLLDRLKAEDQVLLGVDICGECDPGAGEGYEKNDRANAALLTLPFQERFMPVQGGQENKKYEE